MHLYAIVTGLTSTCPILVMQSASNKYQFCNSRPSHVGIQLLQVRKQHTVTSARCDLAATVRRPACRVLGVQVQHNNDVSSMSGFANEQTGLLVLWNFQQIDHQQHPKINRKTATIDIV